MVFPLIPLILVAGTVATVGLQAKDSFFPEKQVNTVTVSRQPKKGTDLSNFSNYQIGGISIFPIIAVIVILILFVGFMK